MLATSFTWFYLLLVVCGLASLVVTIVWYLHRNSPHELDQQALERFREQPLVGTIVATRDLYSSPVILDADETITFAAGHHLTAREVMFVLPSERMIQLRHPVDTPQGSEYVVEWWHVDQIERVLPTGTPLGRIANDKSTT